MKRVLRIAGLLALVLLSCSACLDYVGLDEITLVAGIAIDASPSDPQLLRLSFEIVDTSAAGREKGRESLMIEAEGHTVFEAISNANRLLSRDLYFGNAELLVIQAELAEQIGISRLLESFWRDFLVRDTMQVVISRDETAQQILSPTTEVSMVISYEVSQNLDWHHPSAQSTHPLQIYEIYNILERKTTSLALPALRFDHERTPQRPYFDGMALFTDDKLSYFLPEERMSSYMLASEKLAGGSFFFLLDGAPDKEVSLKITESQPRKGYRFENGQLALHLSITIHANLSGLSPRIGALNQDVLARIQDQAAAALSAQVTATIRDVQDGFGGDALGFADAVYREKPQLWYQLMHDWPTLFSEAPLTVEAEFTITDVGLMIGS